MSKYRYLVVRDGFAYGMNTEPPADVINDPWATVIDLASAQQFDPQQGWISVDQVPNDWLAEHKEQQQ